MRRLLKKVLGFIFTDEKPAEFVDQIGEYDKGKVIVSPGSGGR
jgi:hypothetical protein